MDSLISSRGYFIKAIYDWIVDNDLTPYVLVDTSIDYTSVPEMYVDGGRITLNVAPQAVRDYQSDRDRIAFSACFGGVAMDIYIPIQAVLALYAKENGKGLFFEHIGDIEPPPSSPRPPPNSESPAKKDKPRPALKVVK